MFEPSSSLLLLLSSSFVSYALLGVENFAYEFVNGFLAWVSSLSIWDFVALTWFAFIIDISRNIGKAVILAGNSLLKKRKEQKKNEMHHNYYLRPTTTTTSSAAPTTAVNSSNVVGDNGSSSNNNSSSTIGFAPKISIIVPAHNEGAGIKNTIQSLLENSYPYKEIIVVDDHSTDNTYQEALPFMQKGKITLVQRKSGKGSKSSAINYGVVFATGDYVMIIDGDTLVERTAIQNVVDQLAQQGVAAVSGNVRVLAGDGGKKNLLTKLQAYEYLIAFELGRRYSALLNLLIIMPGAFGVFPRSVGKEIGMYDKDTVGEDFDLTFKLLKTGGKISFASNAIAWTYCPNNWKAWIRQRVRWAHGQLAVLMKHRDAAKVYTYRRRLVAAFYDMILMDILLVFVRIAGFAWIALSYSNSLDRLSYVITLVMLLYLGNELVAILTAAMFSPRRGDLRYVYLVPVAVFFYRPLYSVVRLYAYLKRITKKETKW
jgi:cellulose synthase/poly-beta-1,6-N-acetylglucosamine synthase-like glycosyltransferase